MKSRKTKAAWQGSVLVGIAAGIGHYLDMDPTLIIGILGSIVSLFGVKIAAIGYEDGQLKSNGNYTPPEEGKKE